MQVNRIEFLKALQLVSKAVPSKSTVPMLSNILFEYEGSGDVRLTATNYELSIQTLISGKGKDAFSITMPAKLITDFTNLAKDETIDLSLKDGQVLVKTSTSKNKINCMSYEEFPQLPEMKGKYIEVSSQDFSNAVDHVSFASSIDQGRPVLNGILLKIDEGKLVFCAADGFALANEQVKIEDKYKDFPFEAVISSSFLNIISKSLDADEVLHIASNDNQVQFVCGKTNIIVSKISGQFPDYKMLFTGKKVQTTITISTSELLQACKQVELFATGSSYCQIEITDKLKLSSSSSEYGNGLVELPCTVKGNPITIGISSEIMRNFLSVCNTENAVIDFINPTSFVNFKMEDVKSYYCIVMPMALKGE